MKQKIKQREEADATIRFLGLLKQPDPDPNPFELDESDVVWSTDLSDPPDLYSHSPPSASNCPTTLCRRHHPENSGLSAALSDDHRPLVHRKPTLNPSLSAATAARTIPPVQLLRSAAGKFPQSAPVNVPVWPKRVGEFGVSNLGNFDEADEEDEEAEEEMVPPHVMVARSHVTTFSVFEGVGRTLKGRDLRRVRNAVFQKTGFLD
ncbi:hypothetical protein LOK49_LG07G00140 [Camellia lanceoleosa]|uniref:Uncharacterized protein n=1 Tax=Camellia lanceoleosa TaxID=1840588 RepID=A0ACC0H731_9ERIC|nr:hypothetical protein LOK49_LG07G00140 [Camellia lanceoleosa]